MSLVPRARFLLAIGGLLLSCPFGAAAQNITSRYESVFEQFYRVDLDPSSTYRVSSVTLRKDNMILALQEGIVFMLKPIEGKVTGAVFLGAGVAAMVPVGNTERFMLNKQYGKPELREPFRAAYFRFCDSTDEAIRTGGVVYVPSDQELKEARKVLQDRTTWFDRNRQFQLENAFLQSRISRLQDKDYFVATFLSDEHGWLVYRHDPMEIHEHGLYSLGSLGMKSRSYMVPWSEWHAMRDYGPNGLYLRNPERDGPRLLRIRHSEMELDLPDTRLVKWRARLLVEPLVSNLNALTFDLVNNAYYPGAWHDDSFHPVRVESVSDVSGEPLSYAHRKDQLMVFLPRPSTAGTPFTVEVRGTAEVIYQLTAESYGLLQTTWYPQYGYIGGRFSFDWTIRVPQPFLVTGSGNTVKQFADEEKGQNVTRLKSDIPVTFPWVIFGRFQVHETSYESEETGRPVALTMHSFPSMTIPVTDLELFEYLKTRESTWTLHAPVRKVEQFFAESKEILKLYEKIYGPYPFDELHIAQMAPQLGFGQSPPGFVQLTGAAFLSQAVLENDFLHGFLAHEIAHQWWGNQIGWASGDDSWLSEAFAEYASGIFINEFQGPKRFQRTLDRWRRNALNSDDEAPIAAADTLRGPNARRQRTDLLYNKGPYVLHMLRVQLDDQKYMEVMRALQAKYRHHSISTEQLLVEVSRTAGENLTGFFDQWIWDVGIPKFGYSWTASEQPDGKHLITVHIKQQDAEHMKQVLMPIHIHFKKRTITQYHPVIEADQVIKIVSPMEPKDVTLDDERTLLAEFAADD